MLSYRHGFHAGNFADVQKHIVLVAILQSLLRKETPFCLIDTHAGAGLYDLRSREAEKNKEYAAGIERIWRQQPVLDVVEPYLQAVRAINKAQHSSTLDYYPGSPAIARQLLRRQDSMILTELHTTEYPLLKSYFKGARRVAVHHQDGYSALKAFLPPRERRGMVLIDPAYELKDEYQRCVAALKSACARWPTGIFACWYPIQGNQRSNALLKGMEGSGIRKILMAELYIATEGDGNKMMGSGMLIINPPWKLEQQLADVHAWLQPLLAEPGQGRVRIEWLVPE